MPQIKRKVSVIGLGIMGSAIAVNLQKSGFSVLGSDVQAARRRLVAPQVTATTRTNADSLHHSRFIITSLPTAEALFSVANELADALGRRIKPAPRGKFFLAETSTLSFDDKVRAKKILTAAGIEMLDCPLSGTGAQAKNRDLSVYASGAPEVIRRFKPYFSGFAREQFDVGSFGNGTKTKLVANLLVAIHNLSTAEALMFAKKMGLETGTLVKVLGNGAGGSRMLQVRGPMMVSRKWKPATMKLSIWKKDMTIIQSMLQKMNLASPLFNACIPIYAAAMSYKFDDKDTAAIYQVLEALSGRKI